MPDQTMKEISRAQLHDIWLRAKAVEIAFHDGSEES